ncbi:MAG: diaminopimelate epimerase, partial [Clostridiaceae bacterium]|nr:diaminopimelate epimerase [Clostridiaceae bacterium]
ILKGGDVTVNYSDETVILTGDAEIVFQGTVLI